MDDDSTMSGSTSPPPLPKVLLLARQGREKGVGKNPLAIGLSMLASIAYSDWLWVCFALQSLRLMLFTSPAIGKPSGRDATD